MNSEQQLTQRNTEEIPVSIKEVEEVLICNIVKDERFQIRNKMNLQQVTQYKKAIRANNMESPFPPIHLARKDGFLYLVDGWHRLAAMERVKLTRVTAIITEVTTDGEIEWLTATGNLTHGLPLKPRERRKVFNAYIDTRQHIKADGGLKSYREIAQELKGSTTHTTIRNWMLKDYPELAEQYTEGATPKDVYEIKEKELTKKDIEQLAQQFKMGMIQIEATMWAFRKNIKSRTQLLTMLDKRIKRQEEQILRMVGGNH